MTSLHRLSRNATQPAVGRDVEAFCNRCGMALTHTVVAMVGLEIAKVRCNTCGGEHKYKSAREVAATTTAKAATGAPKAEKEPRERKKAAPAGPTAAQRRQEAQAAQEARNLRNLWQRAMGDKDRADATPYAATLQPRPGQLVDHKTFGYGIVDQVHEGKSRILFEGGYKMLVTGKAG